MKGSDHGPASAAASACGDIVIAPAASIDGATLTALAARGSFSVLYLGSSYAHYSSLRAQLPAGWSMQTPGPQLNAAAMRMRDLFINLDSYLWPQDRDRAAWDMTRFGERGPLASPLMLNLAHLTVLADALATRGPHLIVGDNVAE